MGADDLVANGHDVAIIENHNGDSYTNAASNARNSYYGISGYPTAVFDEVQLMLAAAILPAFIPSTCKGTTRK
jgi:hypothetical protein